jgi:CRISPR-associated endonuclease/helicase Cas3
MTAYFAHSVKGQPPSVWQSLRLHLMAVAQLARERAKGACKLDDLLSDAAFAAGLLHDLGKYRVKFQEYLKDPRLKGNPLTFHKQAGAARAHFHFKHDPIAFAVMGHHGGIPDRTTITADLKQLAGEPTAQAVWPEAIRDCPELAGLAPTVPTLRGFHADLFTRVLFSCLVDADWSDTGEHERKSKGLAEEPKPSELDPAARLPKVLAFIETRAIQCREQHIKDIRAQIRDACLSRADDGPGLFSLTVPTGGGKTLAGLAFALKHAAKHNLRRIIYVAPYMSILEQNISVFREALGIGPDASDLFEHYSLAELPGDADLDETVREAAVRRAENWDAPVIVTTNVQFFESLFSNKPGRCRKLHNIARSVIILDECQSLPPGLVAPTCGMLKQLIADIGCSIVLCTAAHEGQWKQSDNCCLKDLDIRSDYYYHRRNWRAVHILRSHRAYISSLLGDCWSDSHVDSSGYRRRAIELPGSHVLRRKGNFRVNPMASVSHRGTDQGGDLCSRSVPQLYHQLRGTTSGERSGQGLEQLSVDCDGAGQRLLPVLRRGPQRAR